MRPGAAPLISVVVPTRDRPEALSRCLAALSVQTVADALEVIVVDDGSVATRKTHDLVARSRGVRLIRREGSGPAAARNAGARQTRGAVVCFTDDDCIPRSDWAERLAETVGRGADVAAGVTESSGGALGEASEIVAHALAAVGAQADGRLSFAPSNNLACAKRVFESVPFDESYPSAAGEDRDWCARVAAAGYVMRLAPDAFVVHHQDLTLPRFLRQQFRYGQGAYRFRRPRGRARRPLEPRGFYLALLRRGFRQGFDVGLLVFAAQLATAAGFLQAWAAQSARARSPKGVAPPPPGIARK